MKEKRGFFGTIWVIIKAIFTVRWKKDLNIIQNVFYNLILPGSSGEPSLHVTAYVVIMAIGIRTFYAEISRYVFDGTPFSVGYYASLGILLPFVKAIFSYSEKKRKDRMERMNGDYTKVFNPEENSSPETETDAPPVPGPKVQKKFSQRQRKKMQGLPQMTDLEDF